MSEDKENYEPLGSVGIKMSDFADEITEGRDDLWKAKIRLAISESKDGYGVVNPEQLVKYLEMAMEGEK